MHLGRRKILDKSFTGLGLFSIALMAAALVVLLAPIFIRGSAAFVFRATVEHRRAQMALFKAGDADALAAEVQRTDAARRPVRLLGVGGHGLVAPESIHPEQLLLE